MIVIGPSSEEASGVNEAGVWTPESDRPRRPRDQETRLPRTLRYPAHRRSIADTPPRARRTPRRGRRRPSAPGSRAVRLRLAYHPRCRQNAEHLGDALDDLLTGGSIHGGHRFTERGSEITSGPDPFEDGPARWTVGLVSCRRGSSRWWIAAVGPARSARHRRPRCPRGSLRRCRSG